MMTSSPKQSNNSTMNTSTTSGNPGNSGASFRGNPTKTSQKSGDGPPIRGGKEVPIRGGKEAPFTSMETSGGGGGRFGMAGKTQKVAFRIFSNLLSTELSLRPYGGMAKEGEFCIKPGGLNGAIKPFTATSGRKQYKKVGIRVEYSFKQLLSVRTKCTAIPPDVSSIATVFEEGLGDFEFLEKTATLPQSYTSKLRKRSKLPKKEGSEGGVSFVAKEYDDGNDDKATFRQTERKDTASRLKRKPVTPKEDNVSDNISVSVPEEEPSAPSTLSSRSKRRTGTTPKSTDRMDSKDSTVSPQKVTSTASVSKPVVREPEPTVTRPSYTEEKTITEEQPVVVKKPAGPSLSSRKGGWGRRSGVKLDPMAQLHKKITIRLNKITMDNFDTLAGQLEEIFDNEITNTEQLTKLVTLIFEKTVQEHVYGPLYAKLCVTLSSKEKGFDEVVNTGHGMETRQVAFKDVMVRVCQTEFQKGKRPPVFTEDMDATDRDNEKIKVKKILMGTMKFIGQLYLSHLLPHQVMTICLKFLLFPSNSKVMEDDVEAALTLLDTVGPTLDAEPQMNRNELNKFFGKLASIAKSGRYPLRIKIVIENLLDLRKKSWTDSRTQKVEGPKELRKKKKKAAASYEYDDPFDAIGMEEFIGGGDNVTELISDGFVPIRAHVVAESDRKLYRANRYNKSGLQQQQQASSDKRNRRRTSRNTNRRMLLQTEEDEESFAEEKMGDYGGGYAPQTAAAPVASSGASLEIGRKKSRMSFSGSRPCSDGKMDKDDKLSDIMGEYLQSKSNAQDTIAKLTAYRIEDRTAWMLANIQRAIEGGKGERFAELIAKLMDQYIVNSEELDGALKRYFSGYTEQDNPLINKQTPQFLAPLVVDHEVDFSEIMDWLLLDTRDNQDEIMLQYYVGDGIRNCIRGSKTITAALELLGYLLKEMKEVAFTDQQFVQKLLVAHNFDMGRYMVQEELSKREEVENEWKAKYGLAFAFV